jgi:hypothetical protein
MDVYDVAQICPNGHVANASTNKYPQHNQDYCSKCGEKTTTACAKCNNPIRGEYYVPGVAAMSRYSAPACCQNCGSPFPWTERRTQAAIDLFLEETQVTAEEAEQFAESVHDATRDTPAAKVGATRSKKALQKVGDTAKTVIHETLKAVVSEGAKQVLFPK